MPKKLISETNTEKAEGQIKEAFGLLTGREYFPPEAQTVYEYGQWWVVHPPTSRAWSVVDAVPGVHHTGIAFEELEEGEELNGMTLGDILDIFKRRKPTGEEFRRAHERARSIRERERTKRIEAKGFLEEQIAKGNQRPFASNRFDTDVESVMSLVNSMYRAGAKKVDVYNVYREPDGNDHADTLMIDFPSVAQARFAMNLARSHADEAIVKGKTLRLWWD
jgi:hypothetical protein